MAMAGMVSRSWTTEGRISETNTCKVFVLRVRFEIGIPSPWASVFYCGGNGGGSIDGREGSRIGIGDTIGNDRVSGSDYISFG